MSEARAAGFALVKCCESKRQWAAEKAHGKFGAEKQSFLKCVTNFVERSERRENMKYCTQY